MLLPSFRLPPPTLEIVQTLLLSPSCPEPVRALSRTSVLRYLADKHKGIPGFPTFKVAAVREIVRAATGSTAGEIQFSTLRSSIRPSLFPFRDACEGSHLGRKRREETGTRIISLFSDPVLLLRLSFQIK